MKFLCTTPTGPAIFWKFAGLGCAWEDGMTGPELNLREMEARAKATLVPHPLGHCCGFIAVPWLEGKRLTGADADTSVLAHIGKYIAVTAGRALTVEEHQTSVSRLGQMLYYNVKAALGEAWAEQTHHWAEAAISATPGPAYGDGRMAPYEWVRTPDHVLWKTDPVGHDRDHTLVGKQSLLWDVAGALVEWNLDRDRASALLEPLRQANLLSKPGLLKCYEMAYSAFRCGMTLLAAGSAIGTPEQKRLESAARFYRHKLEPLLQKPPARS